MPAVPIFRWGDGNRGALVSWAGRRLFVEWWTPKNVRYWRRHFGPVVLVSQVF